MDTKTEPTIFDREPQLKAVLSFLLGTGLASVLTVVLYHFLSAKFAV